MILAEAADHAHEVHAHHVSAEGEEEALPEAQQTGVAPEQIDRHGDDGVAEIFAPEIDREIGDVKRTGLRREGVEARHHDDRR